MAVKVTVHNSALRRLLKAAGGPAQLLLRRKTSVTATLARAYAAPHGSMTTTIRTSYPRLGVGVVRNEHPAALFVENGTVPHEIRPRNRRALRFTARGSGNVVFTRRVNHPGTKAAKILQRALRDAF